MVASLVEIGCVEPILDCEISDPRGGTVLAIAEAYWPDGVRPGQTEPVVLELDPAEAFVPRLQELGYEVFTSIDALVGWAFQRNQQAAGAVPEVDKPSKPLATTSQRSLMTLR